MRQFIRHPSDIPIEYSVAHLGSRRKNRLRDIGQGGLCFRADTAIDRGCTVRIVIPIRKPEFEVTGTIVWCRKTNRLVISMWGYASKTRTPSSRFA